MMPLDAPTMVHRVQRLGRQLKTAVRDEPPHTLSLKLALVLALLFGASSSAVEVPVRILATLMLVLPALLNQPVLWWVLTATVAIGNLRDWYLVDNHEYLLTYWVLACTLSLHMRERQAFLTDSRLTGLSAVVTGLSFDELAIIPSAVHFLGNQGSVGIPLMLPSAPGSSSWRWRSRG